MKKTKHLLLWSSLGTLVLLMYAAINENLLRDWRTIQKQMHTPAGPVEEQLRQVVAPRLKALDRCVSCHVGMAPGESEVSGHTLAAVHKPVVHDPHQYGCTVCHAGQGRATEQADAHGQVPFWPSPMIPAKYVYAGCGSCHTHINVPGLKELSRSCQTVERLDCLGCHRLDGRGGTVRPGGKGGMEGPDLSRVGITGYDAEWYQRHLAHSSSVSEPLWKDLFKQVVAQDLEAVKVCLESRVGAPSLVEAKALFNSLGCRGCHKVNGVGGDDGPDLTLEGERDPGQLNFSGVRGPHTLDNWLREHFQAPSTVVPGSAMPALGLSEEEIDKLTLYMLSLRRSAAPEALWPKDRIMVEHFGAREFKTDGEALYGVFCASCHGQDGEGRRFPGQLPFPAVMSSDFLKVATNEFLRETIAKGRPGRRMPAWGQKDGGLRSEEIQAVVDYLRRKGGVETEPPRHSQRLWAKGKSDDGRRLYQSACAGCHGREGQGLEAPQLNNQVLLESASDDYLFETIRRGRKGTAMPAFGQSSPAHQAMSDQEIEALVSFIRIWEKQP